MKITRQEVIHVADLARLDLEDAALDRLSQQMGDILEYIDKLKEPDTTDIPPTTHAIRLTNAFRKDILQGHLERDAALSNAPERDDSCFLVPRIIG